MYGDGTLYRRPNSPYWWMSYFWRGEQKLESTKESDRKKARKRLRQRLREIGADVIGAKKFVGPQAERLTVDQILDSLTKDMEVRKKLSPQAVSKLKPVRAALGPMAAFGVTDDTIREYMLLRLKGPGKKPKTLMGLALVKLGRVRPVSNATVNRELQFLGQAYNLKVKEIGQGPSIPKLGEPVREGFYERAEFEAIVAHLPEDLTDFARWGYFTGWRKGEISSLRWRELNMEDRQLRLRGQFSKNGEQRTVPLMGELWEIIQRRWQARRYKGEKGETVLSPLVFFREKGRGVPKSGVPVTEFRKSWKASCEAAGKPGALFHDFRRTAVRNMIRAGVSRRVAMLISSHKTESVFERYNITDDHDLEDAVRKTQAYVAQLPKKREKVVEIDAADNEMEL
jgi:integrase